MGRYDALVLDFDGCVADTAPDIIACARHIMHAVGSTERSDDFIAHSIGGGAKKLLLRVLDEKFHDRLDGDILPKFKEYYDENCDKLTALYPGVLDTLEFFKAQGLKMGLATMKVRAATEKICNTLGIAHFFEVLVTPEDVQKPKPDPESILKIVNALGATPDSSLMIGDTTTDILSGQNAGMDVAIVTYGYGNLDEMRAAKPTYEFDEFAMLKTIV